MRYRVEMESKPGMYAQYSGELTVFCNENETEPQDIFWAAVRELRRTAFSDRGADCWRMVGFTALDRS